MSKTVCDRLRANLLSQGISGVPDRNTAVFDVLQEHGIVQATPDGKAIWRATVTSDTGWIQPFTFLRVSPALIWEASDRPPSFTGTVRLDPGPVTVSRNEVTDRPLVPSTIDPPAPPTVDKGHHGPDATPESVGEILRLLVEGSQDAVTPAAESITPATKASRLHSGIGPNTAANVIHSDAAAEVRQGEQFVQWLREAIRTHRLIINEAKALVHTVAGTAFLVSPGLFQRYVREHPHVDGQAGSKEVEDWHGVQKQFERTHLHKRQPDGRNIWTCEVVGPRRRRLLHGYLVTEPHALFDDALPDNPFLRLLPREP